MIHGGVTLLAHALLLDHICPILLIDKPDLTYMVQHRFSKLPPQSLHGLEQDLDLVLTKTCPPILVIIFTLTVNIDAVHQIHSGNLASSGYPGTSLLHLPTQGHHGKLV